MKLFPKNNKNCVLFAATSNLDFAVANVIIGIEKNSPNIVDKYIIYYDPDDKFKSENIFTQITNKVEFRPFTGLNDLPQNLSFYKRFSKLYLVKYFIFNLLSEFEKVLWLDADICIQKDISEIFSYSPLAWRATIKPMRERLSSYIEVPESATAPNGGVILVSREIKDWDKCTSRCINICNELIENSYQESIDELAFGLLAHRYDIEVKTLPKSYNCGCTFTSSSDAKIIHSIGTAKFWNHPMIYALFPRWKEYNSQWISYGGKNYVSMKDFSFFGDASNKEIIHRINYYKKWISIINKIGCQHDVYLCPDLVKNFIKYYINNIPKQVHYEITIHNSKYILALHFEHQENITTRIVEFCKNFTSQENNYTLLQKENTIGFQRVVIEKNLVQEFIHLVNITKFSIYNLFR